MHEILNAEGGVVLRPWRQADAPTVFTAACEPLMGRQFAHLVTTAADAEEWVVAREADQAAGKAFAFAILREEGLPDGNVTVSDVDRRHLTGWVFYWLLERARGRGLAVGLGLRGTISCWSAGRPCGVFAGDACLSRGYRVGMASPAAVPDPTVPPADPQAIRACLTPPWLPSSITSGTPCSTGSNSPRI